MTMDDAATHASPPPAVGAPAARVCTVGAPLTCAVWWKNAAPYNGQHAIASDGRDGYVFTDARGNHQFATRTQLIDRDGNVLRTRTAPAYLGMSPPRTRWVPIAPVPAVCEDMNLEQAFTSFERSDRIYRQEYGRAVEPQVSPETFAHWSLLTVQAVNGREVDGGWAGGHVGTLADTITYARSVSAANHGIAIAVVRDLGPNAASAYHANQRALAICQATTTPEAA